MNKQTLDAIKSIIANNGVTCDNEQFLIEDLIKLVESVIQDTAAECRNQCLAVHCGESECSEQIEEKFSTPTATSAS